MFITRTPFRLSLFGGGTDYPKWFNSNKSLVISSAFEKYCYIFVRSLPRFFPYRYRLVYSNIELIDHIYNIQHPSIRNVLKFLNDPIDLEISHTGDLPARSGIGSSSTFTVGLLHAMYLHLNHSVDSVKLATDAIHIEQNLINEPVGVQDQIMASYGGLKAIHLGPEKQPKIEKIELSENYQAELESSILLGFSGFSRFSNKIAEKKINNMDNEGMIRQLTEISDISFNALKLLNTEQEIDKIGNLLNQTWLIKRKLVDGLTLPEVDDIYDTGLRNGAIGGKLMGAGGGGFFYFIAPKEKHDQIKKALPQVSVWVPYKITNEGSKMIYNSSNGLYKI